MKKNVGMRIVNVFFPRRCPVCEKIVKEEDLICKGCYEKLDFVRPPYCYRCGKHIGGWEKEYCADCTRIPKSFDAGAALLDYSKDLSNRIVWDVKYHNKREYTDFLARELLRRQYGKIRSWNADVLIPVPMHWRKQRKRGYNQAEVFAKKLGRLLDIPVEKHALKRSHATTPLKELTARGRMKQLEHVFSVNKKWTAVKSVILVDDIYTTGSTAEHCTRALKKAGVENVYVLCVCIGHGED